MSLTKCKDTNGNTVWINSDRVERIDISSDGTVASVVLTSGYIVSLPSNNPLTAEHPRSPATVFERG